MPKHFYLICMNLKNGIHLHLWIIKENSNTSSHIVFPRSFAWLRFGQATEVPNDPKPWIGPSSGWATPRQAVEQPRYSKTFFLTKPKLIILSDQFNWYDIDCFICMHDNEHEASNESFQLCRPAAWRTRMRLIMMRLRDEMMRLRLMRWSWWFNHFNFVDLRPGEAEWETWFPTPWEVPFQTKGVKLLHFFNLMKFSTLFWKSFEIVILIFFSLEDEAERFNNQVWS